MNKNGSRHATSRVDQTRTRSRRKNQRAKMKVQRGEVAFIETPLLDQDELLLAFKAGLAREGLGRLPVPTKAFDPAYRQEVECAGRKAKNRTGFETHEEALAEDKVRSNDVRRYVGLNMSIHDRSYQARLKMLNYRLIRGIRQQYNCDTFASSMFMMQMRRMIIGGLLALFDGKREDFKIVTIVHPDWVERDSEALKFSVETMYSQLKSAIRRCEKERKVSGGILIAFPHSKYVTCMTSGSNRSEFIHHLHCIASGEKLKTLRSLARTGKFAKTSFRRPIVMQSIKDPIRQVSYLFKAFWGHQMVFFDIGAGKSRKSRRVQRLPGVAHVRSLMALDALTLHTACLLMGVKATSRGFVPLEHRASPRRGTAKAQVPRSSRMAKGPRDTSDIKRLRPWNVQFGD